MSQLQSVEARTGQAFGQPLQASTAADIDRAVQAAAQAAAAWAASSGEARAQLITDCP